MKTREEMISDIVEHFPELDDESLDLVWYFVMAPHIGEED